MRNKKMEELLVELVNPEPRGCFLNSAKALFYVDDCLYCEGYACSKELPIPIEHAWLEHEDGTIIDITWPNNGDTFFYVASIRLNRSQVLDSIGHSFPFGLFSKYKTKNYHQSLYTLMDIIKCEC